MRFERIGVPLAVLGLVALSTATIATAEPQEAAEVGEIKRTLDEQEQTIRDLRRRVEELEATSGEATVAPDEADAGEPKDPNITQEAMKSDEPVAPAEIAEAEIRAGRRAPVIYRGALNDRQAAAARGGDYTIDPDYRGFIPIPNTVAMIKFNARPRVDFIGDSGDSGTRFRFVPSKFPASNQDGWRFNANSNASQLRVEVVAPSIPGNFRFFYQNDFFGSNDDPMRYRLQHLYGDYHGVVAGFTFGVFEDPDAWPDTVDYEGPNSVIFARRALGQYQMEFSDEWELTLSIEDPDIYVDVTGDPGANKKSRAPDSGFALRWARSGIGHVRSAAIFRSISVDGDVFSDEDVFGWGINASGSLQITSRDTFQFWFVYGEGIGGMGNDTSFLDADAAFNASGKLKALDYWSSMVAFTHHWTPKWRSTATHGFVNLETQSQQPGDAYHESHYATLNLVYQMFKRFSIGLEGLYGHKEVKDGRDNDLFRIQLGLSFALFD